MYLASAHSGNPDMSEMQALAHLWLTIWPESIKISNKQPAFQDPILQSSASPHLTTLQSSLPASRLLLSAKAWPSVEGGGIWFCFA